MVPVKNLEGVYILEDTCLEQWKSQLAKDEDEQQAKDEDQQVEHERAIIIGFERYGFISYRQKLLLAYFLDFLQCRRQDWVVCQVYKSNFIQPLPYSKK